MGTLTVLQGSGPGHELAGEMAERIEAVIYEYADRVPLALAVGVLEIVKRELLEEQQ